MKRLKDPQALIAVGLILLALFGLRHALSTTTLLILVVIVPSIILHEVAHGVAALACGDDTARRAGRLTLNPLRHIDPLGTLLLPALLALSGLGAFGYAKPVPIDPARMRHPRNDAVVVSLAGPATNLLLAGASILVARLVLSSGATRAIPFIVSGYGLGGLPAGEEVLYLFGLLNVVLAVFNSLPIPPLDGSAVVERLLPSSALPAWWKFRRYAMIGLIGLVLLDPGHFLAHVFGPAESAWGRLLAG